MDLKNATVFREGTVTTQISCSSRSLSNQSHEIKTEISDTGDLHVWLICYNKEGNCIL